MSKRGDGSAPEDAALFLAPEAPYPMTGGGPLRSASLLEYLARRYAVDVVVFREPGATDPCASFPSGIARSLHVIDLPRHGRHPAARALRNMGRIIRRVPPLVDRFAGFGDDIGGALAGRRYRVAVVEHFWCAPYWEQVAPLAERTVLDMHNIESVLHARCARAGRPAERSVHGLFEGACRALEEVWLPRYSLLLAASEVDARALGAIAPGASVATYPNALPLRPVPPHEEQEVVVFSANFGYHPNISAVRFFREAIWPRLAARWPGLRWRLVGKNRECVARFTSGDPRIEATGPVEDAVAEIARARVAVAPLLAGSGTRLKILEAWAAGVPVVSTVLGAEGLPVRDGEHLLLADDPSQFCEAVTALLASAPLRRRLGDAGRRLFEREFTWEAAWSRLDL